MCGIVGIVERDAQRPIPVDEIERMVRTLNHRGPDEEGSVVLPGVGLAMRRLAIVDLAGGQQPFANEDGSLQLVANGEIYNFQEVKRELVARGHQFRSQSDVEVLVHAYEEYGESFLQRIRGMFALALWDDRRRLLLAARDRAGEKPLYYTLTRDGLRLASEIKALLSRAEVERTLDVEALDQFLTYEYVIAPRTIFHGINKLPAAHYLVYQDGEIRIKRYWDAADVQTRPWSDAEAAEALRSTLQRAVRSQMMADVPVGVFLSGGVDSSAVATLMTQGTAAGPVHSFSMGFADGSYNELPYARRIAALCGTEHHEGTVDPDVVDLFDRLIVHLDEPFADVSLFPTFLVSQMAQAHVKVVLTGDGGDELFGGYDAYEAQALAARWSGVLPDAAVRAADLVLERLRPSEKKKGLVNKAQRFVDGLVHAPEAIAQYRWMTFLSTDVKKRLYTKRFQDALQSSDVYAPVRIRARLRARRRCAEPSALCGPFDLSGRRHPRESGSDEHGHVARNASAVSGHRRDGAGLLDARRSQDTRRRAQVRPQECPPAYRAAGDPGQTEGRVQHPDEELAAERAEAAHDATAGARSLA